jgi:hypothetical protein
MSLASGIEWRHLFIGDRSTLKDRSYGTRSRRLPTTSGEGASWLVDTERRKGITRRLPTRSNPGSRHSQGYEKANSEGCDG